MMIISFYKKDYLQHKQHWQPATSGGTPEEAQLDQDQALELNNFDGWHFKHMLTNLPFSFMSTYCLK